MNNYDKLGLYPHNIESYEKIEEQLHKDHIAAIVHATGTGKSFNALQLALDNKDKKVLYVVPSSSIMEHEKEIINSNNKVSLENDFPNLAFRTYQSFINMSSEEIKNLDVDLLILDEFHHLGAPIWRARINTLIETHKEMAIFGMTAYTVRDRGTSYERDMTNAESNELFSNKVVSTYDLCDAMIDGVLPKPNYKSGYIYLEKTCDHLEDKINSLNPNSKDYKDLYPLLKDLKKRVHEAPSISDIFKLNIKKKGKYIYFCPFNSEENVNDVDSIIRETKNWLKEMDLSENDYEIYMTTSEMGIDGKKNRDAFYNDLDLENKSTKDKLKIMFTINQYNEGVHAPGLDGVIMGRSTQSDIVYFEQLGRALSVGTHNKEERNLLETKTKEELIKLCQDRQLNFKENDDNNKLIDLLVAPTIIDLTNNIGYIKELENNLKDRIKNVEKKNLTGKRRTIHLGTSNFDIDMLNEDLFQVIQYMNDRLTMTWDDKLALAKKYFEHHGNLEVPKKFKTINGYEYDENGMQLGTWLSSQRMAYAHKDNRKINTEQIKKLAEIGMRFVTRNSEKEWYNNYALAKSYFEHYGNLEIPQKFKTTNGYDYDEKGIHLGQWLTNQRMSYICKGSGKITAKHIKKLEEIGMRFTTRDKEKEWDDRLALAKIYFEHYGNLEVPHKFKTINGYEYDEKGIQLGNWISNQRRAYVGKGNTKITPERIKKLEEIKMQWYSNAANIKLQSEQITKDTKSRKQKELLNRLNSVLNNYVDDNMPSKKQLNDDFLASLDTNSEKRI